MATFQCVSSCLAADGAVNRRNHVILTGQRNRAILCAADVVARHGAKSSRRDLRRSQGAGVGFVLGVTVGFRNLIRTASAMQRDIERAEAKDPAASRWTVDKSWVHKDGEDHGKDGPPS